MFSRLSLQKESREFSATLFYSTAFCSVDNEKVFHEVLHESVCYLLDRRQRRYNINVKKIIIIK